jgi:transglutaminase-like putative cysteine protease
MTSTVDIQHAQVSCSLTFTVSEAADFVLGIAAAYRETRTFSETLRIALDGRPVTPREIVGPDGSRRHLFDAPPGELTIGYDATIADRRDAPPQCTEWERITALLPSRYCPADRMTGFARSHFGRLGTAADRVAAICDYTFEHLEYAPASSGPTTDAADTLLDGRGVCRDYAHLVATLCRAVEVPARVVGVYAPGLSPMDFHAVVEVAVDDQWQVVDATRLAPRQSLVRVATGRDAADTAFATVLTGTADLSGMDITAVVMGADLPCDDHRSPVHLH